MRCLGLAAALIGVSLVCTSPVTAQQNFPARPITLVVTFPAGGTSDLVARAIAAKMATELGQPIIVDNRPGAAGNIGAQAVARAAPDGYTILNGQSSVMTINPFVYQMTFEPERDLAPVTQTVVGGSVLVVHPAVRAGTLADLIAVAKARPGQLTYASFGSGSVAHLNGELFKAAAGVDIRHIPYRGAAPALNDLVAGHVSMMFDVTPTVLPHVRSGGLKALAVTSAKRAPQLPDVPALSEHYPGFEVIGWQGLFVPSGTPREIIAALHRAAIKALQSSELRTRFADLALEIVGGTPEELAAIVKADTERWGRVAGQIGLARQ